MIYIKTIVLNKNYDFMVPLHPSSSINSPSEHSSLCPTNERDTRHMTARINNNFVPRCFIPQLKKTCTFSKRAVGMNDVLINGCGSTWPSSHACQLSVGKRVSEKKNSMVLKGTRIDPTVVPAPHMRPGRPGTCALFSSGSGSCIGSGKHFFFPISYF
jgi:hypothetical protein